MKVVDSTVDRGRHATTVTLLVKPDPAELERLLGGAPLVMTVDVEHRGWRNDIVQGNLKVQAS